ncbi:bifunctional diguanylate cyclase/phosphodiesterase [Mesorhizobium australicum]|uniref:PAS domain S-box-containing protein/diguanylate cyclase (GGDEF) domain-containing protein n=1 Tax=Mesorhizobium australicum TaxID=536018 RepID=A0A1X7N060_9HYPH|nr:EAL domain-containing protein [Mesorhizobium australicum]SMH30094.1 PAS domain S-box-containing protein/diguanylate cyclase (GGDEF) domain-containing protein [Mesorhizobium australicum]
MTRLYEVIFVQHDFRFIALAVCICALGSLTSIAVAQHALKHETRIVRMKWLAFAGLVTGLGVWATHFTAMLGYRDDLEIHYDLSAALVSIALAAGLASSGWLIGFSRREHGMLAGLLFGAAIAAAHFIDLHAIRVAGTVHHDPLWVSASLTLGLSLGALSGWLFAKDKDEVLAWSAALAFFCAIVSLHFVAMAGVTIVPGGDLDLTGWTGTSDELAAMVVGSFLLLLVAAVTVTWQSASAARITARQQADLLQALDTLRRSEAHHRAYVELNPQIAWVANPSGQITEIAPLWRDLVGVSLEESYGDGWKRVLHPDDLPPIVAMWDEAVRTGDEDRVDARYRVRLVDGSYRWFRVRARPRREVDGTIVAWYGSLEDIHDQVLAEEALRLSEERYRLASRATNDVIWDWSFEDQRATWAGAHKKVLGYPQLQGHTDLSFWLDRIHPDDLPRVLASQSRALETGADYWHEEYRFLTASGEWIDTRSRCIIVRDANGQSVRLVGSMLDITQQKKAEAELMWAAFHDPLTKLPNRSLYRVRLRTAVEIAGQNDNYVALIVLDMNGFKELNDTLGHSAGDKVLVEMAARLSENLPVGATVARLGGDEFAVILPDLPSVTSQASVVDRISHILIDTVEYTGLSIPVSFCGGVALWPRDAREPDELLIAADLALYDAKTKMPGTITEFTPSLRMVAEERALMLGRARAALTSDRVVPFYQPKIDLHSGKIMGWEALLRITGEDGEVHPPSRIAAAFSDPEITVKLTDRMLSRMFSDLAKWRAMGVEVGRLAVNVSAGDFRQQTLAERILAHAQEHGQTLAEIDIEVTEGVLIGQLGPEVSRMLEELRSMGVMVALDDFGTGYASLTHLQKFPVDVIKIDKTFIDQLDYQDAKATAVTDAILQMAKRLDMQTVAEGVETVEQARYLKARGCNIGQGYLFSRPLPASEVPAFMSAPAFQTWEFGSALSPAR